MNTKEMARQLRQRAEQLIKAAEILEAEQEGGIPVATAMGPKMGRIQQLKELLTKHGALKRADVMRLSGIPRGTLGVVMVKKNGFKQDDSGRWFVAK